MSEARFNIFLDRVVKIWTKDGFFRQGKIVEISDDGLMLDDRKDGLTFLSNELIQKISEVRE